MLKAEKLLTTSTVTVTVTAAACNRSTQPFCYGSTTRLDMGYCPQCPECGGIMETEGGCAVCKSCGYSKCS